MEPRKDNFHRTTLILTRHNGVFWLYKTNKNSITKANMILKCNCKAPELPGESRLNVGRLQTWVGAGFQSSSWAWWTARAGFSAGRRAAASWAADGKDTGLSWRGVLCTGTPTRWWVFIQNGKTWPRFNSQQKQFRTLFVMWHHKKAPVLIGLCE